jgi:hypothetical protein
MSKKYDNLAMLVSVIWWLAGICAGIGAIMVIAEQAIGISLLIGGLGVMMGNVQLYLFVEIARDVNEMKQSLRNGIDGISDKTGLK